MSATPSTVIGSGARYSSMRTPRARRSSMPTRTSGTRHATCDWVSAVPPVLREITSCVSGPFTCHLSTPVPSADGPVGQRGHRPRLADRLVDLHDLAHDGPEPPVGGHLAGHLRQLGARPDMQRHRPARHLPGQDVLRPVARVVGVRARAGRLAAAAHARVQHRPTFWSHTLWDGRGQDGKRWERAG